MRSPLRWLLASVRHLLVEDRDPRGPWEAYRRWLAGKGLEAWMPSPDEQAALDRAGFRPRSGGPVPCRSILRIVHLPPDDPPHHGETSGSPPTAESGSGTAAPRPRTPGGVEAALGGLASWLRNAEPERLGVDAFLEAITDALGRLAWPDGTGVVPFPIGARLETALALALDRADDAEQPCLLVGGDLSGIQRFIYTISSTGALKSLRARSLYLEVLSRSLAADVAALATEPVFGQGAEAVGEVYVGGGRFYCILPNRGDVRQALDELIRRRTGALLAEYDGDLRLGTAVVAFSPATAWGDASLLWAEVQRGLSEAKNRAFADRLGDPGFWEPLPVTSECRVCRRPSDDLRPLTPLVEPGDEEPPQACPACRAFFQVGGELVHLRGFAEIPVAPSALGQAAWPLAGLTLRALRASETAGTEPSARRRWILPDHPLGPHDRRLPVPHRVAVQDDGGVLTIEELASRSTGVKWLGIVRMDVDRLGLLFGMGLPVGYRTVAHVASLSHALEQFFSHRLADILGQDDQGNPRSITMVYGGGDDAFWIGPWDQVIEALFDVHRAFRAETGGNPFVTVSAGFIVAKPHTPIYRLAQVAGEAEEAAKDAGRDRVALFWTPGPVAAAVGGEARERERSQESASPYVLEWSQAWELRTGFFETVLREFLTPTADGDRGESDTSALGSPPSPRPLPRGLHPGQVHESGSRPIWRFQPERGLTRTLVNRFIQLLQSFHHQKQEPLVALIWTLSRWRERLDRPRSRQGRQDSPAVQAWKAVSRYFVQPSTRAHLLPFLIWIALLTREEDEQ